ncbi:MAG TPA: hypothetical protein VGE52_12425, partial [Pirellulales bacterium]
VKKLQEEAAAAGAAESSAGGGETADWAKLITPADLVAEVAAVAALCPDDVKNAGFFKSRGAPEAANHHGQLAMLFQIIAQFNGDVKYKDVATGMRALAAKASLASIATEEGAFEAAKASTDAVAGLLKNGKADAPAADAGASWSDEVLDFSVAMKRMEVAQRDRLYKWTATEPEFAAKKAEIIHEARILAVLAQVILDSSYSLAGEGDYRDFAQKLRENCLKTVAAAESGNFDAGRAAVADINLQCDACHGAYR